jgi:tRNA G18 (ribose-2'-O)-methylase SpoU
MTRIDSPSNPRIVAAARALARGERMPIEGTRMLAEALDAGVVPDVVFFEEKDREGEKKERNDRGKHDRELLRKVEERGASLIPVSARVLRRLSDLPSARGIVALARIPALDLDVASSSLSKQSLVVLLDGVQDPSNVGAIVRSAEAFGAEAVLLTAGSALPFTARSLRASAGSALRIPIVAALSPEEVVTWARARGAVLAGAEARGGEAPESLAGIRPLVLAIGSEGHGFSPAISKALDRRLTIPLAGRVESLNAAVAASVLLYTLSGRTR